MSFYLSIYLSIDSLSDIFLWLEKLERNIGTKLYDYHVYTEINQHHACFDEVAIAHYLWCPKEKFALFVFPNAPKGIPAQLKSGGFDHTCKFSSHFLLACPIPSYSNIFQLKLDLSSSISIWIWVNQAETAWRLFINCSLKICWSSTVRLWPKGVVPQHRPPQGSRSQAENEPSKIRLYQVNTFQHWFVVFGCCLERNKLEITCIQQTWPSVPATSQVLSLMWLEAVIVYRNGLKLWSPDEHVQHIRTCCQNSLPLSLSLPLSFFLSFSFFLSLSLSLSLSPSLSHSLGVFIYI